MGCDIHCHFEIKVYGEWHHYSQPKVDRWYQLFGKLAGVRDESQKPIAPVRGLPKDVSFTTKFDSDHWGIDGHTRSWITSKEFVKLWKWIEKEKGRFNLELYEEWDFLFGNGFGDFYEYPESYPKDLEDFRLVFWFDN